MAAAILGIAVLLALVVPRRRSGQHQTQAVPVRGEPSESSTPHQSTTPETFYANLAQVVATFLGICAAGAFAIFVFVGERRSPFDDRVLESKFIIRETLAGISTAWPSAQSIWIPSEFREAYQEYYPNAGRAALVSQAATDLVFEKPPLRTAFEKVIDERDSRRRLLPQQIYAWIYNEVVTTLRDSMIGSAELPARQIFPNVATAPGFEEWRRDFDQIYGAVRLLSFIRNPAWLDVDPMFDYLPESRALFAARLRQTLAETEKGVHQMKAQIDLIDKQMASSTRYRATDRIDLRILLVLLGMAALFGVVVPLWAVMTPKTVPAIICGVLGIGPTAGAFGYAWQSIRVGDVPATSYNCEKWLRPILVEAVDAETRVKQWALVDEVRIRDVVNNEDVKTLAAAVKAGVTDYLSALERYNNLQSAVNSEMIDTLLSRQDTATLLAPGPADGASIVGLSIKEIVSGDGQDLMKRVRDAGGITITLELRRTSATRFITRSDLSSAERDRLAAGLGSAASAIRQSGTLGKLEKAQADLLTANSRLRLSLENEKCEIGVQTSSSSPR